MRSALGFGGELTQNENTMSSHTRPENLQPEILDLGFDLQKLEQHLRAHVLPTTPTMQTPSFGGWSVWSSTGDVRDGWGQGHLAFSNAGGKVVYDPAELARQGLVSIERYNQPTQVCTGYLAEVMNRIEARGLNPRRARITMVPPSGSTDLHRDAGPDIYSVRLHVPIITNPNCFFEYENGARFHMSADGSGCLVRVNHTHRACNFGQSARYHLIMDIYDFDGVTSLHRWQPERETLRGWTTKPGPRV